MEDIQITYLRFLGEKSILKFISKYMHNFHFQSLMDKNLYIIK